MSFPKRQAEKPLFKRQAEKWCCALLHLPRHGRGACRDSAEEPLSRGRVYSEYNIFSLSPQAVDPGRPHSSGQSAPGNKKPPPERRRLSGVPERIRTADLPLRRRTLYPAELRKHLLYPTTPRAKIQPRRHKKDIAFCLAPEEFVHSVGRHTEIYEQNVNYYARV